MRRRLFAAVLLTAALVGIVPASADTAQPRVVSADPVDWTPHVRDGVVWAIAVVGETVVVGGDFSRVTDAAGVTWYTRRSLFAFDRWTGRIRPDFAPRLDGPVYALAAGPGGTVYVGGAFRSVNGAAQRGIARLQVAGGGRVADFGAAINWGDVRALAVHGRWVYAGGTFSAVRGVARTGLARLDAATGTVDGGFDARLAAPSLSRAKVEDLAVSPDGTRLVVIGAITEAAGLPRAQLVMMDTVAGRVANWYTDAYRGRCRAGFETYLRAVDFSPDGSYLVVVTTGRTSSPTRMCDTAARFETRGTGRHRPTWVNHTGGDSLYSVAVTGSAVYVGGHQRWMDNPYGHEYAGPGAVSRIGIGAVHPVTGRALPWNPTRARGVGVRAFVATGEGLLVGSDTDVLAREYHGRLGMFPLA
jgi:hypothetical protein